MISIAMAASIETVTGLILIVRPPLFVQLPFGAGVSDAGQALGRLAGFALLALALACWPGGGAASRSALSALLVFSLLTTIYLVYVGVAGALVGVLFWPAVARHGALTSLLMRGWLNGLLLRRWNLEARVHFAATSFEWQPDVPNLS
jgi:hypothetical protein